MRKFPLVAVVVACAILVTYAAPFRGAIYVQDSPYSAVCDGVYDDSRALQKAIYDAIDGGFAEVRLPAATCSFDSTLRLNIPDPAAGYTNVGVTMRGIFNSSVLKYRGTGSALITDNPCLAPDPRSCDCAATSATPPKNIVGALSLTDIQVLAQNSSVALDLNCCTECRFGRVTLSGPSSAAGTGMRCTSCGIDYWDHLNVKSFATGVVLTGINQGANYFRSFYSSQNGIGFKLDGSAMQTVFRDGRLEQVDVGFVFDDASYSNFVTWSDTHINNTHFVWNAPSPTQQMIRFENRSSTKSMTINNFYVERNTALCPSASCPAYPIQYVQWGTAGTVGSRVNISLKDNDINGWNAGIVESNASGTDFVLVRVEDNTALPQGSSIPIPRAAEVHTGNNTIATSIHTPAAGTVMLPAGGAVDSPIIDGTSFCVCSSDTSSACGARVSANPSPTVHLTGTASRTVSYYCF